MYNWMGGVGLMRPHAVQTGGYDSSGINPGGQHVPQGRFGQMRPLRGYPQMPAPYGQSQGGYDSSGINPGGMYTGGQMPQTPHYGQGLQRFGQSSYQPVGGQFPPQPMTGSQLQPQGLAAMLRGFRPYRFG